MESTAMHLVFFLMGVVSGLAIFFLGYMNVRYRCPWYATIFGVVAAVLIIFTVGWYGSSVVEGEYQAAHVGLLVFGLPALLLTGIAWLFLRKKSTKMRRI